MDHIKHNESKVIYHILGEIPENSPFMVRLISSLRGDVVIFKEPQTYIFGTEYPTMVIIFGCESRLSESLEKERQVQNSISEWLDVCLEIDIQSNAKACFTVVSESMNYQNQMNATELNEFFLLKPSLGLSECQSIITKCSTCQSILDIKLDIINIVVIDDHNPCINNVDSGTNLLSVNIIHITDQAELINNPIVSGCDLIALNLAKKNCESVKLIKLINGNSSLSKKPLLLYGSHSEQRSLIDNQLDYERLLIVPFSAHDFFSVVSIILKKARQNDEIAQKLKLTQRIQKDLISAIDSRSLVSRTNSRGVITYANARFCDTSQYDSSELVGRTHAIVNSGYHDKDFFSDMWKTISTGKIWHGLVCNKKKDGTYYWVDSTVCPIPIVEKKSKTQVEKYTYLSIRTEITDMIINEERLKRSQVFANIGTWDWNIETGDLYWSERIGFLFGYGKVIPELKYQAFIDCIHPEDRDLVTNCLAACIGGSGEYEIEHRVIWPDGEIRWLLEKGDVTRDDEGKALHMLTVVQDITDAKRIEIALENSKNEAEKASQAKSKFLASMSHELRTPMNAIIGFTQLLQMDKENPPSFEQLDNIMEILSAGKHLLQLIDEVLNLAEIESGKISLTLRSVDIGHVICECVTLSYPIMSKMKINMEYYFEGRSIDLTTFNNLGLFTRADGVRTKQIILNLISNACKYNDVEGVVAIALSCENNLVVIEVKDFGKGIKKEDQKLLFKPFNRLGAEQSDVEGTGIGLVITKQLVELMGGDIAFSSRYNEGSKFWFTLPIEERRRLDSGHHSLTRNSSIGKMEQSVNPPLKTILYVEDNPANLRLVAQLIGRLPNVELLSAYNAELGIEIAVKEKPDVILLDINLPGMSGLEALKILKNQPATMDTPIAAISANAMPEDIERALKAGFISYITKPIDVTHMMVEIDRLLNG